jgi:hypothetical protein
MKIYINGVLVGQKQYSLDISESNYDLFIASDEIGNFTYLSGKVDDARVYNRALNQAEITELYQYQPIDLNEGLVAHYEFEGNANDSSGNGNNGVENGGVSYVTGQGASFNGVNSYISSTVSPALTTEITMSGWVKPDKQATDFYTSGGIVLNGGDYEFAITSGTNTVRYALIGITSTSFWEDTGISVALNQWSHVAITYDGSSAVTYIDGIDVHRGTHTGSMSSTLWPLGIGARFLEQGGSVPSSDWYSLFNGGLDDLRIYDRALNISEISTLYDMGSNTNY